MEKAPLIVEKKEMRSLEIKVLVSELQMLVGSRLDKAYQPNLKEFYFQFSVKGKGKQLLRVIVPAVAYIASSKPDMTSMPRNFCMVLRKYLGNAFLDSVEQLGFDRIIKLTFNRGEHHVIIELFSRGNVILLDKDMNIMHALTYKSWKDRSVKRSVKYELPPAGLNPLEMKRKEFDVALASGGEIVRILARDLGLGDAYAEEACLRANVDKKTKKPALEQLETIWKEIGKLLKTKVKPQIVWKGENVIADVVLFPLDFYTEMRQEPVAELSIGLETAFKEFSFTDGGSLGMKKVAQAERIIVSQEEMIEQLKQGIVENQHKGEKIYEHYQEIDALLGRINDALKEKPWKEVKEEFEEKKGILQIDTKKKTVTVELPD